MSESKSKWRSHAAPIIASVLREMAGKPEKEIKAALREAYPFGTRKYWPYKMWCKEVRMQRFPGKRTWQEKKWIAADEATKQPTQLFEGQ